MTINQIQDKIIEEFSVFDDWMDKYAFLIDIGNELAEMSPELKTDDNLISGCQSKVWIYAEMKDGKVYYAADSDAIITKGIASLLIKVLSGQPATDIYTSDLYFIGKIGLDQHLSPTRSNGLLSMIKRMKLYAMAFSADSQK
ncbi:MAG: SufE family protein [Bacteroidales bacterium]|nr:SufE family protein [Bacteroidales bacterium]HOY38471.1 SufE family protein [Bacteroidales bacterium]HQP04364.1 SufE family protein [Bacteroidales bacterium]